MARNKHEELMYDEKLFLPPKIKIITNRTKYIEEKRMMNHNGTSIMNKTDCFNELYLAYKKNDYVAKMIFEDLVVMIEDNIRSFFMLLDPNYIILGAGNYKLKRQMLLDIIDASQYLKDNIKRIKLDVRTQNIMLGLLV